MRLADAFETLAGAGLPTEFANLQRHIDANWIEEALLSTGTATMRRRRLPAALVIWIVIGMALFRDRSIDRVVASLGLALPAGKRASVARSAIAQARERLSEEPLAYLFAATGSHWACESAARHAWRELALFAYDGTTLAVPDSPENRATFGGQWVGERGGHSGYPAVRLVGLLALRSHLLCALRMGPYHVGEVTLARELWREVPDHSLTIVDRGLMVAEHLIELERAGVERHWLARPKRKDTRMRMVQRLGKNDWLVELPVTAKARSANPSLPEHWRVRALTYRINGKSRMLLTSLLDPERYPAAEVIALYHERWDQEMAYDEIKTHLLAREETIRSRTPTNVRQELYGMAIAYNLVRLEMEAVADAAHVAPTRISFVMATQMIRDEWLWCSNSTPGAIPRQLQRLREHLAAWILPPRRSERRYPRAVKVRGTKFPRKPLRARATR